MQKYDILKKTHYSFHALLAKMHKYHPTPDKETFINTI